MYLNETNTKQIHHIKKIAEIEAQFNSILEYFGEGDITLCQWANYGTSKP